MEFVLSYHRVLVEIFLAVIFINIAIAYFKQGDPKYFIKYTRIGYFVFWAFWAMVIFTGLIMYAAKQTITPAVIVMIIGSILLPIIDGTRAVKLGRLWQEADLGYGLSLKYMFAEVVVVAAVTIFAIVN